MSEFYTYTWLRKDGTPYYVGKGKNGRAFTNKGHGVRRPKDIVRILVQHWADEAQAYEMEKWWIAFWGRKDNGTGILRNGTDGGEGGGTLGQFTKGKTYEELYGVEKAKELREKRSKQWKNVPKPKAQKDKMSAASLGKPKDYPIWCTGLTKDTSPILAEIGQAVSKKLGGKTYEEIYGPEKAHQRREHQRQLLTGRKRGPNHRKAVA